jgi:hypothetical protein
MGIDEIYMYSCRWNDIIIQKKQIQYALLAPLKHVPLVYEVSKRE